MIAVAANEFERLIGIDRFLTKGEGIGGGLKTLPEDFIVEEISLPPEPAEGGEYVVATVTARNWETNHLVKTMAKRLHMSRKKIYFAGTKDKRALTTQLMVFHTDEKNIRQLNIRDVEFRDIYLTARPISIGDLLGNRFKITIRNIALSQEETESRIQRSLAELNGVFPNFFGGQRFGVLRPITHLVGKHIAHGDFKEAVFCYAAHPTSHESAEEYEARKFLQETQDFKAALPRYPKHLMFERALISHLCAHPTDYIGALRALPLNLTTMFVYAYQSYLFNKILSERMRRGLPLTQPVIGDIVLPADAQKLPTDTYVMVEAHNLEKAKKQVAAGKAYVSGIVFGSQPVFARGVHGDIEREVIAAEGLSPEDFIIPRMPELTSKGLRRILAAPIANLAYKAASERIGESGDEAHTSVTLAFELQKGTYATSFLRELMKAPNISY